MLWLIHDKCPPDSSKNETWIHASGGQCCLAVDEIKLVELGVWGP